MTVLGTTAPTILHLSGDIDVCTTPDIRRRILGALDQTVEVLILDLSEVTFCGAGGLGLLLHAQGRARSRGVTLALTRLTPQMTRLLEITELSDRFPILAEK
ncbi:anti-sigma factor antagonist [Herbidospora sp. NEAU-GS84]|uniref:Anti-sigma factor antagonist n=1 Tax=Herbidospora solisilvae TaxID=2696284 RepID=A0A7C9J3D4_9ACTN|nr:STAS domain-containing protein [Herbidospora solisilvae]NAS23567.1 anti-sigma factor antagonist [Herbidospora solisilvae]